MATDMKFGPEWLRALSDGGPNAASNPVGGTTAAAVVTSGPSKFKLSEYRYGREEMLALFNHNLKPPEGLAEFPHLFVEKMQLPLALTNMSEDESRLWNRVNSDVVLRLMGKGNNGPDRGGDRPGVAERGGLPIRGGGRGMSERGRGRGRGYYHRNSYEENPSIGDSPPERRDFRNRTFERHNSLNEENVNPRDKKYERGFSRGGGPPPSVSDDNLRKANNSRSSSVENWRTGGRGEDREGWRTARGPTENWNNNNNNRGSSWRNDKYSKNPNDLWDDPRDLPEWDEPEMDAKVGTFDASGAFREDTNDDEEDTKYDDELDNENREDRARDSLKSDDISKKSNQNSKPLHNEYQKESKNKNNDKSVKNDEKFNDGREGDAKNAIQNVSKHLLQKSSAGQSSSSASNKLFKSTNDSLNSNSNTHNVKHSEDSDGLAQFAHLEKEAENMVAQWTADDEPKDRHHALEELQQPQPTEHQPSPSNNIVVLPVQHEDAFKWFYRDPQNEIQGPFTPHEMYDWFTGGFFQLDLLVRRGCDEYFSQLGELMKLWGNIPFVLVQGSNPPPLRIADSSAAAGPTPSHPSAPHPPPPTHVMAATAPHHMPRHPLSSHTTHPTPHPSQPQQQQQNILTNQQSVDMQSQLRLLLAQLIKQEGFSELSQQQQQEVLVQRFVQLDQQRHREQQQQPIQSSIPIRPANDEMAVLDRLSALRIDNTRPQQSMANNNSHVQSIWDMNPTALSVREIEEMQRKEQELRELRELEELAKHRALEEEQIRKKQEDLKRQNEERERKIQDMQKKLVEERNRNQKLMRQQEEETRRREEEERLRREEEELRMAADEKRRQEELSRLEEYARIQAIKNEEEKRQIDMEKERQRQQLHQIERERAMEMERLRQLQQQHQQKQQQEAIIKLQHQQQQQQQQSDKPRKGWGQSPPEPNQKQLNSMSLSDIQRLQEEKDREERNRKAVHQQQQMQALMAAQQQQLQNKQSLGWATPTQPQQVAPVKTLSEIQKEESDRAAKQRAIESKKQQTQVTNVPNAGIWNNANNQLFGPSGAPVPQPSTKNNSALSIGFWEPESRKVQTNRANDSALHSMQTISKGNTNNTQNQFQTKSNARDRKEEESVLRLFENQRRQKTDEFTQWCNEALSKYQSSVDIPTFIAFLKDVESPFEINDYVRSYLGEGKDVNQFAKQFIERRSYFRNRAKKEASEELMWGPAPAITPSVNKPNQSNLSVNSVPNNSDSDMSGFVQQNPKKKKKGKRVIDNSILGFTVQADPDRMMGEIEQIDD